MLSPQKGRQHLKEPLAGSPAWHPQPLPPGRGGSTCDIPLPDLLPQGLWALCKGMPRKRSWVHVDNKHSAPFRGDLLPYHTAAAGRSAIEQDLPPCSRCRALKRHRCHDSSLGNWPHLPPAPFKLLPPSCLSSLCCVLLAPAVATGSWTCQELLA